jgi:CRP-like cAMP-binding protein
MDLNIEKYYLKSVSLLGFLSPLERKTILGRLVRKEFNKREYIFKEGSLSRGIFIVRKGKVKIFQTDEDGKQNIVYFYSKGDFFGHRPILADEPHPVSAVAMENVVLSFIPKEAFLKILGHSEGLAKKLLTNLSANFRCG